MRVGAYRQRQTCALCESRLLDIALNLGHTPLANEFVKKPGEEQEVFPLTVVLCKSCGHLQMGTLVDTDRLFRNYVYVTGTSTLTIEHFQKQAETLIARFNLADPSALTPPLVVEIGSNDGTLLQAFKDYGVENVVGVDPAKEIAAFANKRGVLTIPEFFTEEVADKILGDLGPADVVVANNVFAHAENLVEIAEGVKTLIGKHGVFVFEVSYLRDILDHLAFDTIYFEHFSYHAVRPLYRMFYEIGMDIIDVEWTAGQVGRGSLRIYAADRDSHHPLSPGVANIIATEEKDRFFDPQTYEILKKKIDAFGVQVKGNLDQLLRGGKKIAGFGAPAKLTTLMYTFGLTREYCDFLVDDSEWKQGLYSPGLHIPVLHPRELVTRAPDACVIWAWNFARSIVVKNPQYKGIFITPLPEYRVSKP